jgi:hypothetical protein
MLSLERYATLTGRSERQVLRYLAADRLPGAVKINGTWSIPSDAMPVASGDVVVTSPDPEPVSGDVQVMSRELPPGLWRLEDVARWWDTCVPGIERLAADGHIIVGPYGWQNALRVWVPAR